MNGVIFGEMLRRHWRAALYWGVGLGLLILIQIVALPSNETLQQMGELLDSLPSFITDGMMGGDAAYYGTPEGYIASQLFLVLLTLTSVYAVTLGLNTTANDEDRGVMDMQMSLPISRARLLAEKLAAFGLLVLTVIAQITLAVWIGLLLTPNVQVDVGRLSVGMINVIPATLFVLAFTALISVLLRRRGAAVGVMTAFVLVSYLLDLVGAGAGEGTLFNQLRVLSYFYYHDWLGVMRNGLNLVNVGILLGAALLSAGVAFVLWERRDIGL